MKDITKETSSANNSNPLSLLPNLYDTFNITKENMYTSDIDELCFRLWDKYEMLENIREHSLKVAQMATALAQRAVELGHNICVPHVRASALLHDIAKTYTIAHGGSHAQIGASIVVQETNSRAIAQGVLLHVYWPWDFPQNVCSLPFFIIYADKRIKHNNCVSLEERYTDLQKRYGISEHHRKDIEKSYNQGKVIEKALSSQLQWDLHAYTLNNGRLVHREGSSS